MFPNHWEIFADNFFPFGWNGMLGVLHRMYPTYNERRVFVPAVASEMNDASVTYFIQHMVYDFHCSFNLDTHLCLSSLDSSPIPL